jgi:hypothetical protein
MAYVGDTFRINTDQFAQVSLYKGTNSAYVFKFVDAQGANVNMVAYNNYAMNVFLSSVNTNVVLSANTITAYDGRVECFFIAGDSVNVNATAYSFKLTSENDVLIAGVIDVK